jgi:hypothetical protein
LLEATFIYWYISWTIDQRHSKKNNLKKIYLHLLIHWVLHYLSQSNDKTECCISGSYQSLAYSPWCVTAYIDKTECCISGSYQSLTYFPWCVTACIDKTECYISGSYLSVSHLLPLLCHSLYWYDWMLYIWILSISLSFTPPGVSQLVLIRLNVVYLDPIYQSLIYSPWCVTACIDKTEFYISGSYLSVSHLLPLLCHSLYW